MTTVKQYHEVTNIDICINLQRVQQNINFISIMKKEQTMKRKK